jgi:hypothetical protein
MESRERKLGLFRGRERNLRLNGMQRKEPYVKWDAGKGTFWHAGRNLRIKWDAGKGTLG